VASINAAAGTGPDPVASVLYYHRDLQGSVVATTTRSGGLSGAMGARYRYTPYGQLDRTENVTALTDSELGYTGGLRLGYVAGSPQVGSLLLLGARVYHAELKRWLVPDTVDGRRYTYAGGDPVNFVDPSGRFVVPAMMADLYYRTFYGDPAQFGNWNLFIGGGSYNTRVANSSYLIELQAYADQLNSMPPIYLDGTHWVPFGNENGYLVAGLVSAVKSYAEMAGLPLGEVTMDEQVVKTGFPGIERPQLPSIPTADMIVFSISGGAVTWQDGNGWPRAQYRATSGPYGKGPLQAGRYVASNLRPRSTLGMVCGRGTPGEVGFSVDLTPQFSTERDLLRIHPREGDGTLGCIGLTCEDAGRFRDALSGYFGPGGQTTIVVWVLP
jgi:RHS repeat-associated protein